MSAEKETFRVKPFKLEPTTRFWVNQTVYGYENGEVFFIAGGIFNELAAKHLEKYLRLKKLL